MTALASTRSAAPGLLPAMLRDPGGLFGIAMLAVLVLVAAFGPHLALHDPLAIGLRGRLRPPAWLEGGGWDYPLGTDHLGRDVLSRIIMGARVTLLVGVSVVAIAGCFGTALGVLAGYFGGRLDALVMRFVDTQVAFPGLLIALIILAVIRPSIGTVILVLGINGWMVFARMARGVVLSVRQTPYVEVAEMIGATAQRIILRHILPNLAAPMLTLTVLEFARIILAEASLSFLGVGIQPPDTSWGLDVATGKGYIFRAWWLVTFPGLAIALSVLGVNLLASRLRLALDPTERDKEYARAAAGEAMSGTGASAV
ncbi:MAG: ABC transporter permease [Proteobacteria bacterium]|nr:ABC transporter permease [Pseudomonadota bacterium]